MGLLRKLGLLLLFLAFAAAIFFISPFLAVKISQHQAKGFGPILNKISQEKAEAETSSSENIIPVENTQAFSLPSPIPEKPEVKNFLLTIEKINLFGAKVVPNVDANNPEDYKTALTQGLAHAKTTALPDEGKLVYIFGHSTNLAWYVNQINALFYQIEKLEPGDKVKIEYNGQHYLYHVFDKQIVNPDQIQPIVEKIDDDILVLQSCYPPGTTWKRVLLFCQRSKIGALLSQNP